MKRYLIKECFALQSAAGKLLNQGQYYATDDEKQQEELAAFVAAGSAQEMVSVKKEQPAPKEPEAPAEEQLVDLPGIGKAKAAGLQEAGVATVADLKEKLEDVRELLGKKAYEKVSAYFAE